jgi:hypothetical protein
MPTDDRRLSNEWADLQRVGRVPEKGEGETAKRTSRDEQRQRKRMPTEDRRVGRKIAPTLSRDLVNRLRSICKAEGYIDSEGEGIIASPVIEDLLWAAVEAYDRGEFEREEVVVEVQRRLRRRTEE